MTDSPSRVIIESIEPRTWALRVRDTKTDQVHDLELRGDGPWKIELNGKAEVVDAGGKLRPQVAAPPDDAITLRLERTDGTGVRVGAVGRGAKAWADAQSTLLGSRWVHDPTGAPIVLLEDRPGLVDEIRAALPDVGIDLSRYTAEPPGRPDGPAVAPAANTAPPASLKQSRRGFGGKVKVPSDGDIELRLSNVQREDGRVGVVATGRGKEVDVAEVLAWVRQRAPSLGAWEPHGEGQEAIAADSATLPEELIKQFPGIHLDVGMYQRPGVTIADVAPEDMVFPERSGAVEREDPRVVRILHENIRLLAENFVVVPRVAGYGFRAVELRTDRPAGRYDGLPIGTLLLQVTLHHNADPKILSRDWEPLRKTLLALKRPAVQFDMVRDYVSGMVMAASSAARVEPGQSPDGGEPVQAARDEVHEPARSARDDAKKPARSRGRKKAKPEPGPGPGGLSWEPIEDRGVDGLAARWGGGHFKLLPIGGDRYGLFYEHAGGGYETLLCGTLDDGKKTAGERASGAPPTLDLKAAQVACATPHRTGAPTHDEITLHLRRMEGQRPDLMIIAKGDRVHEWVFGLSSIHGHVWERGEDNLPMASMFDSPTIITDLRKEFPGVNIDTSAYTKPNPKAPSPEPSTATQPSPEPELTAPPTPEPPAAEATPADDQAGADAELMRSFKGELDAMLDEED